MSLNLELIALKEQIDRVAERVAKEDYKSFPTPTTMNQAVDLVMQNGTYPPVPVPDCIPVPACLNGWVADTYSRAYHREMSILIFGGYLMTWRS